MRASLIACVVAYFRLLIVICIASVGFLTDWLRDCFEMDPTDDRQLHYDSIDKSICSITFDEDVSCIFVVWKPQATGAQFRLAHEARLIVAVKKPRPSGL